MKIKRKHLFFPLVSAIIALLTLISLFHCGKFPNNNPADSQYQGDYQVAPDFAMLPDTLEIFTAYTFSCTMGADSFKAFMRINS